MVKRKGRKICLFTETKHLKKKRQYISKIKYHAEQVMEFRGHEKCMILIYQYVYISVKRRKFLIWSLMDGCSI